MLSELAMKQRTEWCVLKSHRYPGIFKKFFVTKEAEGRRQHHRFLGSSIHLTSAYLIVLVSSMKEST
jgi:hypothetical protein